MVHRHIHKLQKKITIKIGDTITAVSMAKEATQLVCMLAGVETWCIKESILLLYDFAGSECVS